MVVTNSCQRMSASNTGYVETQTMDDRTTNHKSLQTSCHLNSRIPVENGVDKQKLENRTLSNIAQEAAAADDESSSGSSQRLEGHYYGSKQGDMVFSLLSILGTHNKEDMSRALLAMSTSYESCIAMRQSGCLPLLIHLLHGGENDTNNMMMRSQAAAALHNIVHVHCEDQRGRQEARVLRLLEQIRGYSDYLRIPSNCQRVDHLSNSQYAGPSDFHPGPAVAALMKLSFDEEHRHAVCTLGGVQAIAELLQMDHEANGSTTNQYHVTMRRYACMALTNLTFGDGTNKALLCSMVPALKALVQQLESSNEDLCQVAASVLRNLSWHADLTSKRILRDVGSVRKLMQAALIAKKESTLKSLLSALWNFSSHCTENKADICATDGALQFLIRNLTYRSPLKTLSIIENCGGILRNISSHIAVREDYRAILRQNGCLQILLKHLRSPSLTVVSNACGTLWNLSAHCVEDQKVLLELGAMNMLKNLVHSKHKMISMGSAAALKNLLSAMPSLSGGTIDPVMTFSASKQDIPGLHVRRQRALESELEQQNLSETCDNMESPQASPTESPKLEIHTKLKQNSVVVGLLSNANSRITSSLRGVQLPIDPVHSLCRSVSQGNAEVAPHMSPDSMTDKKKLHEILHRSNRLFLQDRQTEPVCNSAAAREGPMAAVGSSFSVMSSSHSQFQDVKMMHSFSNYCEPTASTSPETSPTEKRLMDRSFESAIKSGNKSTARSYRPSCELKRQTNLPDNRNAMQKPAFASLNGVEEKDDRLFIISKSKPLTVSALSPQTDLAEDFEIEEISPCSGDSGSQNDVALSDSENVFSFENKTLEAVMPVVAVKSFQKENKDIQTDSAVANSPDEVETEKVHDISMLCAVNDGSDMLAVETVQSQVSFQDEKDSGKNVDDDETEPLSSELKKKMENNEMDATHKPEVDEESGLEKIDSEPLSCDLYLTVNPGQYKENFLNADLRTEQNFVEVFVTEPCGDNHDHNEMENAEKSSDFFTQSASLDLHDRMPDNVNAEEDIEDVLDICKTSFIHESNSDLNLQTNALQVETLSEVKCLIEPEKVMSCPFEMDNDEFRSKTVLDLLSHDSFEDSTGEECALNDNSNDNHVSSTELEGEIGISILTAGQKDIGSSHVTVGSCLLALPHLDSSSKDIDHQTGDFFKDDDDGDDDDFVIVDDDLTLEDGSVADNSQGASDWEPSTVPRNLFVHKDARFGLIASLQSNGESVADIMSESFPELSSSLLSDMAASHEDVLVEEVNSRAVTSPICEELTLKFSKMECDAVVNNENEEGWTRVNAETLELMEDSSDFQCDISMEQERALEENAKLILSELERTTLLDSRSSETHLLECETISLVSNDEDDELLDIFEASYASRSISLTSIAPSEHGSEISSTTSHTASVNIVRPSGPRIVKPVAKETVKKEEDNEDVNQPKSIRGRRKLLYSGKKKEIVKSADPVKVNPVKPVIAKTTQVQKKITGPGVPNKPLVTGNRNPVNNRENAKQFTISASTSPGNGNSGKIIKPVTGKSVPPKVTKPLARSSAENARQSTGHTDRSLTTSFPSGQMKPRAPSVPAERRTTMYNRPTKSAPVRSRVTLSPDKGSSVKEAAKKSFVVALDKIRQSGAASDRNRMIREGSFDTGSQIIDVEEGLERPKPPIKQDTFVKETPSFGVLTIDDEDWEEKTEEDKQADVVSRSSIDSSGKMSEVAIGPQSIKKPNVSTSRVTVLGQKQVKSVALLEKKQTNRDFKAHGYEAPQTVGSTTKATNIGRGRGQGAAKAAAFTKRQGNISNTVKAGSSSSISSAGKSESTQNKPKPPNSFKLVSSDRTSNNCSVSKVVRSEKLFRDNTYKKTATAAAVAAAATNRPSVSNNEALVKSGDENNTNKTGIRRQVAQLNKRVVGNVGDGPTSCILTRSSTYDKLNESDSQSLEHPNEEVSCVENFDTRSKDLNESGRIMTAIDLRRLTRVVEGESKFRKSFLESAAEGGSGHEFSLANDVPKWQDHAELTVELLAEVAITDPLYEGQSFSPDETIVADYMIEKHERIDLDQSLYIQTQSFSKPMTYLKSSTLPKSLFSQNKVSYGLNNSDGQTSALSSPGEDVGTSEDAKSMRKNSRLKDGRKLGFGLWKRSTVASKGKTEEDKTHQADSKLESPVRRVFGWFRRSNDGSKKTSTSKIPAPESNRSNEPVQLDNTRAKDVNSNPTHSGDSLKRGMNILAERQARLSPARTSSPVRAAIVQPFNYRPVRPSGTGGTKTELQSGTSASEPMTKTEMLLARRQQMRTAAAATAAASGCRDSVSSDDNLKLSASEQSKRMPNGSNFKDPKSFLVTSV